LQHRLPMQRRIRAADSSSPLPKNRELLRPMPKHLFLVSRPHPPTGLDNRFMNHFCQRNTRLLRSSVQPATQPKALLFFGFFDHIPPVDSNGRRPKKPKFVRHAFIADQDLLNLHRDALRGQYLSDQFHGCGMRRTFRDIQNFNFQFPLLKIGQCAPRFRSSRSQLRRARCSSCSNF